MSIPQVGGYGYELPYQYYQNQLWQNPYMMNYGLYGMNMPTFCASPTADTYQPKVSQVSANQEIKQNDNTKKSGMSKGAKWLLGIAGTAATVYGGVVLHRHINKPTIEKITKNFSEIFRRDVSKDEAQKMVGRYKEIFEIKDKDEFCRKAFEQIKRDYGYGDKDIPLVFENLGGIKNGQQVRAHWNQYHANIAYNTEVLKNMQKELCITDKKDIIADLVHEFQHVKQHEYSFRANSSEYLDLLCNNEKAPGLLKWLFSDHRELMRKDLISKNSFITESNVDDFIENVVKKLDDGTYKSDKEIIELLEKVKQDRRGPVSKIFGNYEKFAKNSEEYKLGLKYIEAEQTYNNTDMNEYWNNLLETEAHGTKDKLQNLFKILEQKI